MTSVQPRFHFSLDGLTEDLHVLAFKGKEAISTPYAFDIELISENPNLNLENPWYTRWFADTSLRKERDALPIPDVVTTTAHSVAKVCRTQPQDAEAPAAFRPGRAAHRP